MLFVMLAQGIVFLGLAVFYAVRDGDVLNTMVPVLLGSAGGFIIGMVLAMRMKKKVAAYAIGGVQRRAAKDPKVRAEEEAIAELHQVTSGMPDEALYLDSETRRALAVLRSENTVLMTVTEMDGDLKGLSRIYPLGTNTTPRRAPLVYQVHLRGAGTQVSGERPWSPKNPGAMILTLDEIGELLAMVKRARPF